MLRFLTGLSHSEVVSELSLYGFVEADADRGWALLQATAPYAAPQGVRQVEPAVIQVLDEFENKWFPIVQLALGANYPAMLEPFFEGLGQASGTLVIVSVTVFLDRLELLEKGEAPFGPDGPAARKLLEQRGLTAERVAGPRALLAKIRSMASPMAPRTEPLAEEEARAAAEAVWTWYREWSGILRHSGIDRRWLYRLGILSRRRRADDEDLAPEHVDTPELPAGPEAIAALPAPSPTTGE